jgi:pimeloyl-ACP methyl ester carboxylesterase
LLQSQLASGNVELAAETFVDSLNVPGTWAKRTPAQKQRFYDNMVTAAQMSGTPPTTCEQVTKFDFPILLVHGENSPKNFSAMSDAMRKCKAVAEPIVIPGAAHNMYVDSPAVFLAALFGFLSRDLVN